MRLEVVVSLYYVCAESTLEDCSTLQHSLAMALCKDPETPAKWVFTGYGSWIPPELKLYTLSTSSKQRTKSSLVDSKQ